MSGSTSPDWQDGEGVPSGYNLTHVEIEAELHRVLGSAAFRKSAGHTRFLEHVVRAALSGQDGELKEYWVGLKVFDRPPDFNPAIDTVVRTEARRLRARLTDYYQGPGKEDPVVIDLPKGGYLPVFCRNHVVRSRSETGPTAAAPKPPAEDHQVLDIPDRRKFPLPWLAVVAPILVAAFIAAYLATPKPAKLTDKDSIVLADFDNKTGDPVFDDTLKQGLAVQLEQSPFLDLVSDSKATETLKRMDRPAGGRMTAQIAREVCLRTGSAAMVTGSIVALGEQYVVGLKAVNCNTGDVLAEAQEQAADKESVLKALDGAASSLRAKLGESLSSVQKYATTIEEATTPSLEALKAYSLGRKANSEKGDLAALPFYQRAVELDPDFAMAYRNMASVYRNQGEDDRAAENARRAYELRGPASERERFSIETAYYMNATGELEKAAQTCDLWQQIYPRDHVIYGNAAPIFAALGNLERALEDSRETLQLYPDDVVSYANLGASYQNMNQLAESDKVYQQADERKLSGEFFLGQRYMLAFLNGDATRMAQLVATAAGKPGPEDVLLAEEGDTEAWHGRLNKARELTRQAMDSAKQNDAKETAAAYQSLAALREVVSGNKAQAIADARAALKMSPNREVKAMAALALALAGDVASAEKLAEELAKAYPLDTLVLRYRVPNIRAAIALQHNDPEQAVEVLKVTKPIELGDAGLLLPIYLRGEAYLQMRNGQAAAAEFQKFLDHRGLVGNFSWAVLARLGLARAYALDAASESAARDKARAAYQDFLKLWKDADPGTPVYLQAKAEYAKLR